MGFMSLCKRGEEHVSYVIELHFNKKIALNAAQRYTSKPPSRPDIDLNWCLTAHALSAPFYRNIRWLQVALQILTLRALLRVSAMPSIAFM